MKGLPIIIIMAMFLLIPSVSYPSELGSLRISLIRGDVQLRDDATGEWSTAMLNMPLMEGDTLWVPEAGRLEIQMNDGSFLRLDEDSTLRIIMISAGIMWFELKEGRAYVNFKGRGERTIKIGIPYLTTLRTDDPSRFSIYFRSRRYTEVAVFKGRVYADVNGEMTGIYAGQRFTLDEDMYADITRLGPSDEWVAWNRERDRRFERTWYSYRYLPDELRVYAYEFDRNGRWVYTVRYGYVWVPTVYIGTEWVPYRYGRWVWRGGNYVWISDEPWGWVPYHYGRWTFSISIGWFWVPPSRTAVYWGPGFVGWIYTPDYVAWVPLAPEDIYYGYGYYGPRSVNIVHIDIRKTVIKNVYRNVHVNSAVTVVNRDSFKRGRYIIRTDVNPFVRVRPQRTRMVSERVSLLPVRKDIVIKDRPAMRINIDRRGKGHERGIISIRKETVEKTRYNESTRRRTAMVQRTVTRNNHIIYRQDSSKNKRITINRKQRVRTQKITQSHMQTPEPRHIKRDRAKPEERHLTNRQPRSKKRIYKAEKKSPIGPYIKNNKKRDAKRMVHEEDRHMSIKTSRWMHR
jgi:hypothetical protein